ncbi:SDR family oxidoreductase [Aspergillus lucknowensis]|uniref:Oxidoreductase n=1 Tax=Aspergillus lucknowensis TaxID=176173 RepID=A0ABR4M4T6_9EURO
MAPFPSATRTWHSTSYPSISPSKPSLSAKGKTVLITGGGTGIGGETARSFAVAGASRIALLGRRIQPLLDTKAAIEREYGQTTTVFVASTDVTKKSEVDAAFEKFVSTDTDAGSTKVDILVSNAATTGPFEGVEDSDPNELLNGVNINLSGALYIAQAFSRFAAPDAVIIDVNSNAAHLNYAPRFASYSIAKLAVFRLWDMVGFANPAWSVFHIQPGVVDTEMNRAVGGVKAVGYEDHVSLPGSFNVWLASSEARFLKGKYLYANWDVDELKERSEELERGTELSIGLVGWPFDTEDWQPKWDA